MSDQIDRAASRAELEAREGHLVFARIKELRENPIAGKFDAAHLQAIHGYIFQDTPRHHPGEIREDTGRWSKQRALEGKPGTYEVPYLADGVEARLKAVLDSFGGPGALRGLSVEAAAEKLAKFYGDLDHAHGFYEGNSRTLREFTRSLVSEAGFKLDWTGTSVTADHRNYIYAARDLEVITRHYPGVTPATANTREEYEAALQVESFRKNLGDHPLRDIIRNGLSLRAAVALANAPAEEKTGDIGFRIEDYRSTVDSKGGKMPPAEAPSCNSGQPSHEAASADLG